MRGFVAFMFAVGGCAALIPWPGLLPAYLVGLAICWFVTPTTSNRRNRGGNRREERE